MRKVRVAQVYVDQTALSYDKPYDYIIPYDMSEIALPGQRVMVPFGKGNRKRQGIIIGVIDRSDLKLVKPIVSVLDKEPLLNDEMLKLAMYMKEHTFCTFFDAAKPLLPAGINMKIVKTYLKTEKEPEGGLDSDLFAVISYMQTTKGPIRREKLLELFGLAPDSDLPEQLVKLGYLTTSDNAVRRVGDATVKTARLLITDEMAETMIPTLTEKQKKVVRLLLEAGAASVKEICYFTGVTAAVITTLEKKEILELFDNEVMRNPYETLGDGEQTPISLSDEQQNAFLGLNEQRKDGGSALLYGVTGSGKTQVFLKLIDETVAQNKGAIVMVPEIALTPQTLSIFHKRYGKKVAVFHSAMSLGQRMDEWKRIKRGEAMIAVGTRSAVFAPIQHLGLIVMDEEQEHTYKSEGSPRYHAREVARFRCAYHKALFVMASATPSVSTYTLAQSGRYRLYTLKNRYGSTKLPEVQTVNMRKEMSAGNFRPLSGALIDALRETYEKGNQSILLLNRRGYHVFVSCRSCGKVMLCPNCSISMTYHSANGRLMCHYCGHSEPFSDTCSECGAKQIRSSGFGTQMVEEELKGLFPEARILRMDSDTTMTRFSHEKHLNAFGRGEYDIMLGTQMVAKGLDFPKVTLVGVINADQTLYNDDFRASERAFSLLTQVVGRSGRGGEDGTALVQTVTPENTIITLAKNQDYDAFYETEILSRKMMVYPPYCDLCLVGFTGEKKELVKEAADLFFSRLTNSLQNAYKDLKLIVLGPSPASVPKINSKYRYRLIIKCKNSKRFRELISSLLTQLGRERKYGPVTVFADIGPENIL